MRRRRIVSVLVLGVIATIAAVVVVDSGGRSPSKTPSAHPPASTSQKRGITDGGPGTIAAAESGLLPWTLTEPLSRSVVLAGPAGQLEILGGLTASGTSASGIFSVSTANGSLTPAGTLTGGLHDSSGAVIHGADVTFGGGSPVTVATVQSVPAPGEPGSSSVVTARVTGSLPQPRSDSAAVTVGGTTYVVGGYDGSAPDPAVVATTDGRTFSPVANLPIPVRYPAVATSGGLIYVFGGQAVAGRDAGQPVSAIQLVDPRRHIASVSGHLPLPLDAAVAVAIGKQIYVAGGESSVPQQLTPGVGTTQLGPPPAGADPGAGATSATATAFTVPGPEAPGVAPSVAGTLVADSTGPSGAIRADASSGTSTVSTIWAYSPATGRFLVAGRLQVPVSHSSAAVVGNTAWLVGGESDGTVVSSVQTLTANPSYGYAGAPGAGSPYFGLRLLIADRGNNRFLVLDAAMHITWTYPSATSPPDPYGFVFPDDAFFIDKGKAIISNQEENETIVEIAYPSGRILWEYGHPHHAGSAPGYLHEPDDAYLLKNGIITVADAQNCRILFISHSGNVVGQIGTTGVCVHSPPKSMGSPNGDTPLADGNVLVSEINGSWISEYTGLKQLVWTAHVPVNYPSDPQQLGPDLYLVADYSKPGAFIYTNRAGQVIYRYSVTSGPGMLNHPSLAERIPSGAIMINDDYANRMVAIDPTTGALVWQYGITDAAGTAVGMLNTPDGFDLLAPDGSTPTHTATG